MAKRSIITNKGLQLLASSSEATGQYWWIGYYGLAYVPNLWKGDSLEFPDDCNNVIEGDHVEDVDQVNGNMTHLTENGDMIWNIFQGSLTGTGFYNCISDGSVGGDLFSNAMYPRSIRKHYKYILDKNGNNTLVTWVNDPEDEEGNLLGHNVYLGTDGFVSSELPIPAPLYYLGIEPQLSVANYFPSFQDEDISGANIYPFIERELLNTETLNVPKVSVDHRGYNDSNGNIRTFVYDTGPNPETPAHPTNDGDDLTRWNNTFGGEDFDELEIPPGLGDGSFFDNFGWFAGDLTRLPDDPSNIDPNASSGDEATVCKEFWKIHSISNYNRFHAPTSSIGLLLSSDLASRNMATVTKLFPISNYKVINTEKGVTSDGENVEVATAISVSVNVDLAPDTKEDSKDSDAVYDHENQTEQTYPSTAEVITDDKGENIFTATNVSFKFNRIGIYAVQLRKCPDAPVSDPNGTNATVQFEIDPNSEPVLFAVMDWDNTVVLDQAGDGFHQFRADININLESPAGNIDNDAVQKHSSIFYNLYEDDAITWYKNQLLATASTGNAITEQGLEIAHIKNRQGGDLQCCPPQDLSNKYASKNHTHDHLKHLKDGNVNGSLRGISTLGEGVEITVEKFCDALDPIAETYYIAENSIVLGGAGNYNHASPNSIVGSGAGNYVYNSLNSGILTGLNNVVGDDTENSHIGSGTNNRIACSENSMIGSGVNNLIDPSHYSFIGAGSDNNILNSFGAFIPAGRNNYIESSDYSTLMGRDGRIQGNASVVSQSSGKLSFEGDSQRTSVVDFTETSIGNGTNDFTIFNFDEKYEGKYFAFSGISKISAISKLSEPINFSLNSMISPALSDKITVISPSDLSSDFFINQSVTIEGDSFFGFDGKTFRVSDTSFPNSIELQTDDLTLISSSISEVGSNVGTLKKLPTSWVFMVEFTGAYDGVNSISNVTTNVTSSLTSGFRSLSGTPDILTNNVNIQVSVPEDSNEILKWVADLDILENGFDVPPITTAPPPTPTTTITTTAPPPAPITTTITTTAPPPSPITTAPPPSPITTAPPTTTGGPATTTTGGPATTTAAPTTGLPISLQTIAFGAPETGQYTSIDLDASNNPHIAYYDPDNDELRYTLWDGQWEQADGTPGQGTVDTSGNVGIYASLDLNFTDTPYISYHNLGSKDLKFTRWTGAQWVKSNGLANPETVDSVGEVGQYTSIKTDDGDIHISYRDNTNKNLKYTKWSAFNVRWEEADGTPGFETVDNNADTGWYTSLAVDSSGIAHIAYYDFFNGNLKYAKFNGSTWDIVTVDGGLGPNVGHFPSIRLDGSENPCISYLDATNTKLRFTKWNGADWTNANGDVGFDDIDTVNFDLITSQTSLALDGSDVPHIAYADSTSLDIKIAIWNGSSWDVTTVDSTSTTGAGYVSMDIDATYAHISYYSDGNLKYAKITL